MQTAWDSAAGRHDLKFFPPPRGKPPGCSANLLSMSLVPNEPARRGRMGFAHRTVLTAANRLPDTHDAEI